MTTPQLPLPLLDNRRFSGVLRSWGKKFGFIRTDANPEPEFDRFLHVSQIVSGVPCAGTRLTYQVGVYKGKSVAVNAMIEPLVLPEGAPANNLNVGDDNDRFNR